MRMHETRSLARLLGSVAGLVLLVLASTTLRAAPSFDEAMQPVLDSYLTIHRALSGDSLDGVVQAARAIETAAADLKRAETAGENAEQYRELPAKIEQAARKLAAATDLEAAREAFRELSMPVAAWAVLAKPAGVVVAFCPMAGASWVQPEGDVLNPYFGKRMLHCGHIVGEDFEPCPHGQGEHGGCGHGCGGGGCPHKHEGEPESGCCGAKGA